MKTSFLLLATAMAALIPGAAQAQQRALSHPVVGHPDPESLFTSRDRTLNRNKQAALHIQRELLKCHEWSRASEWLTDKYIQHNPVAASGLAGVVHYFVDIAKQQPLSPCPALSARIWACAVAGMAAAAAAVTSSMKWVFIGRSPLLIRFAPSWPIPAAGVYSPASTSQSWNSRTGRCSRSTGRHTNQ